MSDNTTPRPWAVVPMGFNVSKSGVIIPTIGAEIHPYADVVAKVGVIGPQRTAAQVWADAALIVRAVNAHDALVAACEAWDQGFVDGEDFDADQFLAWVNRNRRLARAALGKARAILDGHMCAMCLQAAHARACRPLRAVLFADPPINDDPAPGPGGPGVPGDERP